MKDPCGILREMLDKHPEMWPCLRGMAAGGGNGGNSVPTKKVLVKNLTGKALELNFGSETVEIEPTQNVFVPKYFYGLTPFYVTFSKQGPFFPEDNTYLHFINSSAPQSANYAYRNYKVLGENPIAFVSRDVDARLLFSKRAYTVPLVLSGTAVVHFENMTGFDLVLRLNNGVELESFVEWGSIALNSYTKYGKIYVSVVVVYNKRTVPISLELWDIASNSMLSGTTMSPSDVLGSVGNFTPTSANKEFLVRAFLQ